jgi:hypothetical protein
LTVITTNAALEAMCKPDANGQVHVKRTGPKGLLLSTWGALRRLSGWSGVERRWREGT